MRNWHVLVVEHIQSLKQP